MASGFDFIKALVSLQLGGEVTRQGWNVPEMVFFIKMQLPGNGLKMTNPYIYLESTNLRTRERSRVPWAPTNMDMFAEDWRIVTLTEEVDVHVGEQ